MATVAVVILNYNGQSYLEKCLPSVVKHTANAEIVVVDNHSSDDSIPFLKAHYAEVTLIELAKNYGFAKGYNQALEHVHADYIVLLNSDVEVTGKWLSPLIDFLAQHPDYAACQPKILDYNQRTHFEFGGAAGGLIDSLGYPYCRGRIFNAVEEDTGQYEDESDILWASGACLAMRADAFKKANGFDTDFFAHMEEIDLCWRWTNEGNKLRYIPTSRVYHVGGGTLDSSNAFKTYLNFRNALFMIVKNMHPHELLWKLPLRMLLDWVAILKFRLDRKPKHAVAIGKAHLDFMRNYNKMLKKRGMAKKSIRKPFSVVAAYFLLGKRKYTDL